MQLSLSRILVPCPVMVRAYVPTVTEPQEIPIEDGPTFVTIVERGKHFLDCDVCENTRIGLGRTVQPGNFLSDRRACLNKAAKKAAKQGNALTQPTQKKALPTDSHHNSGGSSRRGDASPTKRSRSDTLQTQSLVAESRALKKPRVNTSVFPS